MPLYCGFNPDTDVPDLSGKVILLTGGTGGVGKTAVIELAKHNPGHIYFTGRNQAAADTVLAALPSGVKATFLRCDLTSLESIRDTAAKLTESRLDVFIANAGIMAVDPALTKDGYEIQFGTNHLGNAALLLRLLPIMNQTAEQPGADVRFVSLTSLGYAGHPSSGIEFENLRTTQENIRFGTWGRYSQSKLANVLFAKELARRFPKIASSAIHPGVVQTELVTGLTFWKRMFVHVTNPLGLMTPEQGCYNTVWAATGKDFREKLAVGNAALFEPVKKVNKGDAACWDEKLAKELWDWTEKQVGVKA